MILTTKQKQIMCCLIFGKNPENTDDILQQWLTISDLVEYVPYETSRDSMQFSIRALIKKGLVKKGERELRNGRFHIPLIPTDLAIELIPIIKPYRMVSIIEDEEFICEEF